MSSAIQNILASALGDVARSTKFEAWFAFTDPKSSIDSQSLVIASKTSSFPGISHSIIDFKYKGRTIPIKGQVKYTQTWECTFFLTEDHKLKQSLETWIEALDQKHNYYNPSLNAGLQRTQKQHKNGYTTELFVYQRDFEDKRNTIQYTLHNAFPTEITPVQVNYESKGELLEFTVTFAYSHFTVNNIAGAKGNFIDDLVGKVENAAAAAIKGATDAVTEQIDKVADNYINPSLDSAQKKVAGLNFGASNASPTQAASQKMGLGHGTNGGVTD